MPTPFEKLAELDRLIHEPARLSIVTALSVCENADFLFLQRITGLTKGNLSQHLSKLEESNIVSIQKDFVGKMPRTRIALTEEGRSCIADYWEQLTQLQQEVSTWQANWNTPLLDIP